MAACDQGARAAQVAKWYDVSESFIEKLTHRRRASCCVAAWRRGSETHAGGPRPRLAEQSDALRTQLKAKPDTTLAERREGLGLPVALSTLWYHVDRLWLTFNLGLCLR